MIYTDTNGQISGALLQRFKLRASPEDMILVEDAQAAARSEEIVSGSAYLRREFIDQQLKEPGLSFLPSLPP